ncbi:hypothetical protein [Micromonospora sp. NPDC050276]|uniref:hypothetical protein n=1 Tax=Micromonospora sp. NPDC050276 TaxID=3364278 RepID=UPI0037AD74DF
MTCWWRPAGSRSPTGSAWTWPGYGSATGASCRSTSTCAPARSGPGRPETSPAARSSPHVSLDDYRIIPANLAGGQRSTADRLIPYTVFTTPEPARVGLTETEARRAGYDVQVAQLPVAAIPRGRTLRPTQGMWGAATRP